MQRPSFDPTAYGERVARILALDGDGGRLMPLAPRACSSEEARRILQSSTPSELFPGARAPEAALSGLWLYFSCLDEAHRVAQDIETPDGSYWHAIMHRQEPDPGNSAYWFRRAGRHPVFPALAREAAALAALHPDAPYTPTPEWDPFAFIDLCERARSQPGSTLERLALQIQLAEWQLLFDHCAGAHRK